jgi:hypothetical protein
VTQIVCPGQVSSCTDFFSNSICRSTYEYCCNKFGRRILIKMDDGSSYIDCPSHIMGITVPTIAQPDNKFPINCYPVCNSGFDAATSISKRCLRGFLPIQHLII